MKTVGDFKRMGCVIVAGDFFTHKGIDNEKIKFSNFGAHSANNGLCDSHLLVEFAWRTNTGEKPSFDGVVQLKNLGSLVMLESNSIDVDWSCKLWHEWRPSLNQGDKAEPEKPTYTKAMYEAGEIPRVGMQVSYQTGEGRLVLCADDSGICIVAESGVYKRVAFSGLKPIQAELEKAVEEITGELPHACKSTIELMIDAEYRKC